jgi:membrane protease subunit (stomatin/prohibitin family)
VKTSRRHWALRDVLFHMKAFSIREENETTQNFLFVNLREIRGYSRRQGQSPVL